MKAILFLSFLFLHTILFAQLASGTLSFQNSTSSFSLTSAVKVDLSETYLFISSKSSFYTKNEPTLKYSIRNLTDWAPRPNFRIFQNCTGDLASLSWEVWNDNPYLDLRNEVLDYDYQVFLSKSRRPHGYCFSWSGSY